jgi:hypothetical protein
MDNMNELFRKVVISSVEPTTKKLSKVKVFIRDFLDKDGYSELIQRYELPDCLKYTSGDGIFRNDATLGKTYKFFRFSPTINFETKCSNSWILSDDDKVMIKGIHSSITFPEKSGQTTHHIQFFGKGDQIDDQGIREDIKCEIKKKPCASCGTSTQIECDHKNDLKNEQRVLNRKTQTIDDFQALCKHCNDVKRAMLKKTKDTGKRQPSPGFHVEFTEGSDYFDKTEKLLTLFFSKQIKRSSSIF